MRFTRSLRLTVGGAVPWDRLVAKVPVHRIKKLHCLLVGPYGVDDKCEQSEASEEEY